MRNISLTTAALLGAVLLAPTGTAAAAGETCQGQAATIVGAPGGQVTGTEGADVIVTNGAMRVDALGGDDLVCATGEDPAFPGSGVLAVLGAGADTFLDSSGRQHLVYAGAIVGRTDVVVPDSLDTETDTVRVIGRSTVVSGTVGRPNADTLDLAAGELGWSGVQTAPGSVSLGSGVTLGVRSAGDVRMDATGAVTGADTALTWTGEVDRFVFTTSVARGRFTFRGTGAGEHVKVDAPGTFDRDVALGGGKDSYESNGLGGRSTRISGDGGRDQLLLALGGHGRVRADLGRSRVTGTEAGVERTIRVRGFDDLVVAARRAVVVGTDRANEIGVIACRTTVKAKKGPDFVHVDAGYGGPGTWTTPRCGTSTAVIDGGPGNDGLAGSPGRDRLIGGPGKDVVLGAAGRDVCQGEKTRSCERRI